MKRYNIYTNDVGNDCGCFGWRLEVGGWRLEVGGWRLGVGGWGLEVGSFGLPTVESYHAVERSIKTMPLNRFCNIVDFF
jgi:hypothetical protein